MEVLVTGTPIIGSDCIGLREVLQDSPASVIAPADARALADAIEFEMTAARRDEFMEWAPQAARRFALDGSVAGLHALYHRMAATKHDRV
jgi:glycosyltransferase involved in cell wall biosynthesis